MGTENRNLKRIRLNIAFFMFFLVMSGVTAFPLETEITFILRYKEIMPVNVADWMGKIRGGLTQTNEKFPFIAYGTDWLAFAHLVIAVVFIGPYIDPVKNIWVLRFGLIACFMVIPFAFIAGSFREIPIYWRLIDCSFGILGLIPLSRALLLTVKTQKT